MQNSVEYLQGRKCSTLQAQRWLSGRIWVTGLNSSTSQYGAQRQAVEYLVKLSIRFQNRSSRFWCFTFTSKSEGFFLRWMEFRVNRLFQVTRISAGYIIIMTRHRSNEYAEFGISPSADFRFKEGDNHRLESVSVYVSYVSPEADHSTAYPGRKKSSDEGGKAIKGVLLFSWTLLSSIFCYLLLHNFSLFVSFVKFFTVNFIHSDLPFNCLNRLTVYTAFINHFTSLYIVFNLPFGPYLVQRFNRLKCPFRFNTSVNFVCALDIYEWFWPQLHFKRNLEDSGFNILLFVFPREKV